MLSLGGSSRCWRTNAFLQSLRIFMVEWTQPPKRGCRIPLALSQRLPAGKRWTCGPCTPIWRPTGGLMIEISSLSVCAHLYSGTDIAWDGIEWPCTRLRSRIWNPWALCGIPLFERINADGDAFGLLNRRRDAALHSISKG